MWYEFKISFPKKAYFITSDTHIRLIANVTAEILKLKTVALEIFSSII